MRGIYLTGHTLDSLVWWWVFLTANVVCFRDPSDQWMNAIHNMRQGERGDPALRLTKFDCKLN